MSQMTQTPHFDDMMMPGDPIESRPLHLIILADCSYSMHGAKIASLNNALVEAFDACRGSAKENPTARILVRAIAFESSARWHITTPTPVEELSWPHLKVGGSTDMAGAIRLLTEAVALDKMPTRGLPPILVLISDGMPDCSSSYNAAVEALLATPWGKKGVRVGIGIGDDVEAKTLERFVANPEFPILFAKNAAELANRIRWATVVVTQAVSTPLSQAGRAAGNVVIPPPPPMPSTPANLPGDASDVW